jgi:putative PIN family toxin of toxin-antitoxin system
MRLIVDTNVWVSAFLTPGGTPAQLLHEVERGRLTLVYSPQIEAEYREVLFRSKFNINPDFLAEFFARLEEDGQRLTPVPIPLSNLPDPDDAFFIATALAANCPIVTGNARHFPAECGVEILSPAQCLARLIG